MKLSLFTLAAGLFGLTLTGAEGQNLVANGGFETGDFTGWNTTISGPFTYVDNGSVLLPNDGAYYALFGNPTSDNINQVLPTTPAGTYDVNYWVNDTYGGSDITVKWGTTTLSQLGSAYNSGQANNGWVDFDFQVAAPAGLTELSFTVSSQTVLGLDDVSVTAVPEPSTTALSLIGLVLAGGAIFRVRRQAKACV